MFLETTTNHWEATWHRRERRQRSSARLLLTLAKATEKLQAHHSAQRPPRMTKTNQWLQEKDWKTVYGKGTDKAQWDEQAQVIVTKVLAELRGKKGAGKGYGPSGEKSYGQEVKGKGKGKTAGGTKGTGKGAPPRSTREEAVDDGGVIGRVGGRT